MPASLTNAQLSGLLDVLAPLLDKVDIVGYAAARNAKLIRQLCLEFLTLRDKLIAELGEPEIDESGNETGFFIIKEDSPNFKEFINKLDDIASIEHEFTPFKIPIEKAIGVLSGSQMLALDWML